MTLSQAFHRLKTNLQQLYAEREAAAIAHEVMEKVTQLSKIDRLIQKDRELDAPQVNALEYMEDELMQGKPLQYVTGSAWFMEREFVVNEQVLIPRPETEELVMWILNDHQQNGISKRVMDIGTGSGCIPVSLKAAWPEARVSACDISEGALNTARQNAAQHQTDIHFFRQDIVDESLWEQLPETDIVVSNPPYIPAAEEEAMERNVTAFEPHLALFVPDKDPFLFYRTLARLGKQVLSNGGIIYCEIHRDFPEETKSIFEQEGYSVEARKDMHDNWRMIKASR